MELQERIRDNIFGLLRLLASPDEQREYQRNVPFIHVPSEMFCMWGDDLYHPDDEQFRKAFSPQEIKILREFDQSFQRVCRDLAVSSDIETFIASGTGTEVAQAAKVALIALSPERYP